MTILQKISLFFLMLSVVGQNSMAAAVAGDFIPADTVADIGVLGTDSMTVGAAIIGVVLTIAGIGIIISILKKK